LRAIDANLNHRVTGISPLETEGFFVPISQFRKNLDSLGFAFFFNFPLDGGAAGCIVGRVREL